MCIFMMCALGVEDDGLGWFSGLLTATVQRFRTADLEL